jgi:hypothetical protein
MIDLNNGTTLALLRGAGLPAEEDDTDEVEDRDKGASLCFV